MANIAVIRVVNAAYREKYGEHWPDSANAVVRRWRLNTTLRLIAPKGKRIYAISDMIGVPCGALARLNQGGD